MVNRSKLLWASFLALIAAGMGMSIRGAILEAWGAQFGFTQDQLGEITGAGFIGFGLVIVGLSFVVDFIGYKPLMILAFILHLVSFGMIYSAQGIFTSMGGLSSPSAQQAAFLMLYRAAFVFSIANGICETVINPLVATLYPKEKTHYLNILHAGWPAGLILGGLVALLFAGGDAWIQTLHWTWTMGFFLIPTFIYAAMILFEKFPKSEATAAGIDFGTMLAQFAAPLMLILLVLHACVGYVELGTDSWMTNIMSSAMKNSVFLIMYTSLIMFVLRFFAGPIVHVINPVGLLLISAICGCTGLFLMSNAQGLAMVFLAATIYGFGKTFLWPTMLGLVGERFPKGGALTMGTMGGIGMLSAGLLGSKVIGWQQDYFASEHLKTANTELHAKYEASKESELFGVWKAKGLDGAKVGEVKAAVAEAKKNQQQPNDEQKTVLNAVEQGGRSTLRWTARIPAAMAAGYFLIFLYFMATGGYKQEVLTHHGPGEGESSDMPTRM